MKETSTKSNVLTQIVVAAIAIILGYLVLFRGSAQVLTLCQILCGGLILAGAASIASYFIGKDYKRIDRYGFAVGVMLILAGIIGLIRITELTANFDMYAGALSLLLGVLALQGSVQIKILDYAIWVLTLILAIICLGGAFCILAGITAVTNLVKGFGSWMLLIGGCVCLFTLLVTWVCILLAGRRDKKLAKEAEEQAAAQAAAQTEAQAAAQAQIQAQAQNARDEILQGEYQQASAPQSAAPYSGAQSAYGQPSQPSAGQYGQSSAGQYGQPSQTSAGQPAQPAETHHAGFAQGANEAQDLPVQESPELTFEPSEGHHTEFTPER